MKYDLVVLSTETLDSCPSVALSFVDKMYVFNVPDQSQRVYRENRIRFPRLSHIFLTNLSGRALGGFHGLIITVLGANNRVVNFTAPEGFNRVLESYTKLHTLDELRPANILDFSDENITVKTKTLKVSNTYEIQMCDVPGKFQVEKARALGLKSGPIYSDLQHGKTVTLPDGRVITPDQVMGPSTPGDLLLVVDCHPEDVEMLDTAFHYDFVVHFTQYNIMMTPEYLSKFDTNEKALCFAPSSGTTFPSIALLYAECVKIAPNLFHPLVAFNQHLPIPDGMVSAVPKLEYAFAPVNKKRFIFPKVEDAVQQEEVKTCELPKFETFAVTFLGTGAMFPSKYRNVASILIHTESGYIILDAGEGCTGQLRRIFGVENSEKILKNLICVWISHLHGDHHFGLYQLLQTRAQICDYPVPLICHKFIADHMMNLQEHSGFGSLKFIHYDYEEPFVSGMVKVTSIRVDHCFDSQGCAVDVDGGYRIAYSGDRSVRDEFPASVAQCDLMIHEASFTDDLVATAASKHHSTIGQAIATGKAANAKFLILTHFSQRYPKIPVFGSDDSNVAFACDYLTFNYEQAEELCRVCPEIFRMIVELEAKEDDKE